MRTLLAAAALLVATSVLPAHAATYDISNWDCARVKGTLQREGMAVLRYRSTRDPSISLYDRYVFADRFCKPEQRIGYTSVPTRDDKTCPVKRCEHKSRGGSNR